MSAGAAKAPIHHRVINPEAGRQQLTGGPAQRLGRPAPPATLQRGRARVLTHAIAAASTLSCQQSAVNDQLVSWVANPLKIVSQRNLVMPAKADFHGRWGDARCKDGFPRSRE